MRLTAFFLKKTKPGKSLNCVNIVFGKNLRQDLTSPKQYTCLKNVIFYILRRPARIVLEKDFFFFFILEILLSMKNLNAYVFTGKFMCCYQLESIMGIAELVLQVSNFELVYAWIFKERPNVQSCS